MRNSAFAGLVTSSADGFSLFASTAAVITQQRAKNAASLVRDWAIKVKNDLEMQGSKNTMLNS
jgi:hypothetical protein